MYRRARVALLARVAVGDAAGPRASAEVGLSVRHARAGA